MNTLILTKYKKKKHKIIHSVYHIDLRYFLSFYRTDIGETYVTRHFSVKVDFPPVRKYRNRCDRRASHIGHFPERRLVIEPSFLPAVRTKPLGYEMSFRLQRCKKQYL